MGGSVTPSTFALNCLVSLLMISPYPTHLVDDQSGSAPSLSN
jgi:hypothetical protein